MKIIDGTVTGFGHGLRLWAIGWWWSESHDWLGCMHFSLLSNGPVRYIR